MIESVSITISKAWAESGIINGDETESYRYGLELLISTALNLLAVICISVVLGHLLMFVPYLVVFIPMRLFAGGYHAGKHWMCILVNSLSYFVALFTTMLLSDFTSAIFCIAASAISLILVFVFAPVEARNKPLYEIERVRNRRISLVMAVSLLVVSLALYFTDACSLLLYRMAFCGEAVAMFLMVVERVYSK